jgi:hypothetical protein
MGAIARQCRFAARQLAHAFGGRVHAKGTAITFVLDEIKLVFEAWHDAAHVLNHLGSADAVRARFAGGEHRIPCQPAFGPVKL